MPEVGFYRYFLGFRPDPTLCRSLASVGGKAGQRVCMERLHLTLCVIAEIARRDPFLLPQVKAALAGHSLSSCAIRLGTVRGGTNGAMVGALGCQREVQDFYQILVLLLAKRGLRPLHRKSGLHAHITLGHEPCRFAGFNAPMEWFPTELLLIESQVGLTRHNLAARWPLLPPRQGALPFDRPLRWRTAA